MERFISVGKESLGTRDFVSLEQATHLFKDDKIVDIDRMEFFDVKSLINDGYEPCVLEDSETIAIQMDETTAKQLMFLLGHINSANSPVFHPFVGTLLKGETLYEKMAQVLGDIFESEEALPYKLEVIKSTFGDPVLSLKVLY